GLGAGRLAGGRLVVDPGRELVLAVVTGRRRQLGLVAGLALVVDRTVLALGALGALGAAATTATAAAAPTAAALPGLGVAGRRRVERRLGLVLDVVLGGASAVHGRVEVLQRVTALGAALGAATAALVPARDHLERALDDLGHALDVAVLVGVERVAL